MRSKIENTMTIRTQWNTSCACVRVFNARVRALRGHAFGAREGPPGYHIWAAARPVPPRQDPWNDQFALQGKYSTRDMDPGTKR